MIFRSTNYFASLLVAVGLLISNAELVCGQADSDALREAQYQATAIKQSNWIHWGYRTDRFSSWTNHSNRLIPVYAFGTDLATVRGEKSVYRAPEKLQSLYGYLPDGTVNPKANYFDQTDVYYLNRQAFAAGKKHVILMVFDGMDWQTIKAASVYRNKSVKFSANHESGLAFQDYQQGSPQYGFCVTSPHNGDTKTDVNSQVITSPGLNRRGGYAFEYGGATPWDTPADPEYLVGRRRTMAHAFTDSAASATSLNAGVKTFNGSINIGPDGKQVTTLAHQVQKQGIAIGVVTSVPISHATPAAVYSHNVTRNDYQDLTRDLLGLRSISHRDQPLLGVDVLIGCGWGESRDDERSGQGNNYVPGNRYLAAEDLKKIDVQHGGKYVIAQRQQDRSGQQVLTEAAKLAAKQGNRLFGFFGTTGGHLPYQTADGKFDPTRGISRADRYTPADIQENPTLADMTAAALKVLETNKNGFYLMIEAGDVDWANHNNNIDDSIGAVYSGEAAFETVTRWVEQNSNWDETCLILTADHGHYMFLDDPRMLAGLVKPMDRTKFNGLLKDYQEAEAKRKAALEAAKQAKAAAAKQAADKNKADKKDDPNQPSE